MKSIDYAAIEVEGMFVDAWTSYSFSSDLFTPADAFSLSFGVGTTSSAQLRQTIDALSKRLVPGAQVKLWIGADDKRALQGTGVVDSCRVENDAGGTQLSVSGRDLASYLISSAADPKLYEKDDTLLSIAKRAVAPWNIEVTADHVAGRDLRQARIATDRLRRLQDKARAYGIPPKYMSEKIAVSIDRGTITFDDFAKLFYSESELGRAMQPQQAKALGYPMPFEVRTLKDDYDAQARAARAANTDAGLLQINSANQTWDTNKPWAPAFNTLKLHQLRIKDIRPQSGETVWEYLDRHARRNGLLMSLDPKGRLLLSGLHYDQLPSYQLRRRITGDRRTNNILSGGRSIDGANVYKTVRVYGRTRSDDATRSPFKGEAINPALKYEKTMVFTDSSIKSKDDAQKRAEYEMQKSKQDSDVLEYSIAGHSSDGLVFATDAIAHVEDHVTGVDGAYYITSRTFTRSVSAGPLTQLRLVPRGSIVLPEPS